MTLDMRRRDLLKSVLAGAALTTLGGRAAQAAETIGWMTWENLAKDDYLAALIEKTGIKIDKTFIGTDDEQFAKLRAGGASSVDLITPGLDKVEATRAAIRGGYVTHLITGTTVAEALQA